MILLTPKPASKIKITIKLLGFTLLEILIALTIFSVLMVLTAQGLRQALNTKKIVFAQMNDVHQIQFALSLIQQDLQQATNRPILGQEMRIFPPFIGQAKRIEITRHVPTRQNLSKKYNPFLRVQYSCEGNNLIRYIYDEMDSVTRSKHSETLIHAIKNCRFAFINANKQVLHLWRAGALRQNQRPEPLPLAIQLNYDDPKWGRMVLLFAIPEAIYA